MLDRTFWLEKFSPACAAVSVSVCAVYGMTVYDRCWRSSPNPVSHLMLEWSDASHRLLAHSIVLSFLTLLALASTAGVLYLSVAIFGRRSETNTVKGWRFGLVVVLLGGLTVISRVISYARILARYPAGAYSGGTWPYFYWHFVLMQCIGPFVPVCAGLCVIPKRGRSVPALAALVFSAFALRFLLNPRQDGFFYYESHALAPALVVLAFLYLFLHFRSLHNLRSTDTQLDQPMPDS